MLTQFLTALAPEVVSIGAKKLYEYSGIGDVSFGGQTIGDYITGSGRGKAVKGVTKTAIEQKLLPNFMNMPSQTPVSTGLGQVSVGSPPGFEPFSRGSDLLYRGNTGRIDKAIEKPNVQQYFIKKTTANSLVKYNRANRRIRQNPTQLGLQSLRRGQIQRAL